ncbi:MAG: pseudouridine synthase [Pseudomonadota bacterium]
MPDRRETHRAKTPKQQPRRKSRGLASTDNWDEGERIAKYLARAGIASRREVEAMIDRREVRVDGRVLTTPAFKVTGREDIKVRGETVRAPEQTRLWLYHKPAGLITTTNDPEGRRTIFEELPKSLPRVITIGRLDLTTEGLLLLTNSGELARALELPSTGLERLYRARAHGDASQNALDTLKHGVQLEDGTRYAAIEAVLERETGTNNWIQVKLTEGQNREVRKALERVGLKVNRLIRTQYGPFELGDMRPGSVQEITAVQIRNALSDKIAERLLPELKQSTARKPARSPNKTRRRP